MRRKVNTESGAIGKGNVRVSVSIQGQLEAESVDVGEAKRTASKVALDSDPRRCGEKFKTKG